MEQTKKRYNKEFRAQVLEVYKSDAYPSASACAKAYDIKEIIFINGYAGNQ